MQSIYSPIMRSCKNEIMGESINKLMKACYHERMIDWEPEKLRDSETNLTRKSS